MYNDLQSSFISSTGISYLDTQPNVASSKPIICILHGLFGSLSNFHDVIFDLKNDFRIILPTLPLFQKDYFQTLPDLTLSVISFLKSIGVTEPIHFIGNSLGGQIAVHIAIKQPTLVKSLVLTGSAGLQENTFGFSKPRRFCRDYVVERSTEVFHTHTLDEVSIDEISDVLSTPSKLAKLLKIARNSKSSNVEKLLPHIHCQSLLIWGKNDQITIPETAILFNKLIPDSELKWIPECGHAPMMENPKLFSHYCNEFYTNLNHTENESTYVKTYHSL